MQEPRIPVYFILGAIDRFNFGDLLFPHILSRYISERFPAAVIRNYALLSSNLKKEGGLPTYSYRRLADDLNRFQNINIILCGGTLLGATWNVFLPHSNRLIAKIYSFALCRRVINRFDLGRRLVSPIPLEAPFILDHSVFSKARIKYNAVGGIANSHWGLSQTAEGRGTPKWTSMVRFLRDSVAYLSVRDSEVKSILEKNKIRPNLAPDCATIVPDLFEDKEIENNCSNSVKSLSATSDYCVVQFSGSPDKRPPSLELVAGELEKHSMAAGIKVILCPLGIAPGHDDRDILSKLAGLSVHLSYIEPKSIWDILYLIKNCNFFMGTSLHGLIIAHAYNRPAFYFEEIAKVKYYADTWLPDGFGRLSIGEYHKAFDNYDDYPRENRSKLLKEQQQRVYDNLNAVISPSSA